MTPISSPVRTMLGTTPDVDSVMRRREMPMPSLSATIVKSASRTASKLYRGSPMPIITTLVTRRLPVGCLAVGPVVEAIARHHDLAGRFRLR